MLELSLRDAKDLLEGCAILSTGGGGRLDKGLAIAEVDYAAGRRYVLVGRDEVEENGLYTCPYFCGSIAPGDTNDPYNAYPKLEEPETVRAVEALERFMGKKAAGIVSIEYGGGNTAEALSVAARLGRPVVDADGAGRAVPDLQFSTFYLAKRSIAPLAVASSAGDCAVFERVVDDFRAEALVRALAVVSGNAVGMADHPVTGKELQDSVIWGALSYAMKIGRLRREAFDASRDPVAAVLDAAGGWLLFTGAAEADTKWKNEGGFTIGEINLKGSGSFAGESCRIWFKNENMMTWKNGEIHVTCPDLICLVDAKTGYPILNPGCKKGDAAAVLGFKAPEIWRSERGLSILCPRFFGFDVDWTPVETIMGQ
jgi:DUF917 family protein